MSLSPETQLRNTILSKVFSLHWTTDFRCASHNHRCIKPGHAGCCYKHLWKDDSGAQWTTAYDCDRMLPVQRVQVWLSPLLHVPLSLLVEQRWRVTITEWGQWMLRDTEVADFLEITTDDQTSHGVQIASWNVFPWQPSCTKLYIIKHNESLWWTLEHGDVFSGVTNHTSPSGHLIGW